MARSVEEVAAAEAVEVDEAHREAHRDNLVRYARSTAIYFNSDWPHFCSFVEEELQKRTDALIDERDPREQAYLSGICWTLRWLLKQKKIAEGEIHRMRTELDEVPAAGENGRQGAAHP